MEGWPKRWPDTPTSVLALGLYTHIELEDQSATIESLPAPPEAGENQTKKTSRLRRVKLLVSPRALSFSTAQALAFSAAVHRSWMNQEIGGTCMLVKEAEGLRYANQSMRRFRWHRSACASWTYNEPWPNAAQNCVVEYLGRPKMAYYYTKQAFASLDVMAVYSNLEAPVGKPMPVELWGVNDRLEPLTGYRCRYRITDLCGKTLGEKVIAAEVPAEGNVKLGAVQWTPPAKMEGDVALLWLDLLDEATRPIAQHLYTFGVITPSRATQPILAPLLEAPRTTLTCHVVDRRAKPDGETEMVLRVQNAGPSPALFVKVDVATPEAEPDKIPPRRDWVYIDDNYFSLPAGETRRIRVTLAPHAPKEPAIRIQAWNADATKLSLH